MSHGVFGCHTICCFFQFTRHKTSCDQILPEPWALLCTQQSYVVYSHLAEWWGSGQHAHTYPYCQRTAHGDGQNTHRDRFRHWLGLLNILIQQNWENLNAWLTVVLNAGKASGLSLCILVTTRRLKMEITQLLRVAALVLYLNTKDINSIIPKTDFEVVVVHCKPCWSI